MISVTRERERIGGKKSPPLPYVRTHAQGREGEKRVKEKERRKELGRKKRRGEESGGQREAFPS